MSRGLFRLGSAVGSVPALLLFVIVAAAASPGAAAAILSGHVLSPGGSGVGGVDLDVYDAATGNRLPTEGDSTDADGSFGFLVPNGLFDVVFNVPKAAVFVSTMVEGVIVAGDTDMGDITLEQGVLLSGRVIRQDFGIGVFDADIDVDDSFTGERIVTPEDNSDLNGNFSVVVPVGTLDVTALPQKVDRLVALRMIGLEITGATSLGTLAAARGFEISGNVSGPGGSAAGVDLDFFQEPGGALIPTAGDDTDGSGHYTLILPAGTYTVKAGPPLGQGTARRVVPGYVIAGNQTLNLTLSSSQASVVLGTAGRLVNAGASYAAEMSLRNNLPSSTAFRIEFRAEDPVSGAGGNVIPPKNATLPGATTVTGSPSFTLPASVPPQFVGVPLHYVVTVLDSSGQVVIDSDFLEFRIR